jgi:hypothetical protein
MSSISRQIGVAGTDARRVAEAVVDQLAGPDLRIAFVFADGKLDPNVIATITGRGLAAPVVGGTTVGVIHRDLAPGTPGAVGLGFYGDAIRATVGVATELTKSAITRGRDAVRDAAVALGTTAEALIPARHVALTIIDGAASHEEAVCIGAAAAAPTIRMVGGCSSIEVQSSGGSAIWVNGHVLSDAAIAIVLECDVPFHPVSSSHLISTDIKTVVTAASGCEISELDGRPAATRLRDLVAGLGAQLDVERASHSFARFVGGVPYARSITHLVGTRLRLTTAVEPGQVLRVMRPGDLVETTRTHLAAVAQQVGGTIATMLAFSCIGRHLEAHGRGLDQQLAAVYAAHNTVGFQSYGEQSGMLLVNHTLTGLAIGSPR